MKFISTLLTVLVSLGFAGTAAAADSCGSGCDCLEQFCCNSGPSSQCSNVEIPVCRDQSSEEGRQQRLTRKIGPGLRVLLSSVLRHVAVGGQYWPKGEHGGDAAVLLGMWFMLSGRGDSAASSNRRLAVDQQSNTFHLRGAEERRAAIVSNYSPSAMALARERNCSHEL
ncbi:hypothetical protein X797_007928 [Metarhizium robertsii]|uniref:Uncharacterized protein n=1 Tax=Metarhizium robertsii TaxID=568076 RepID=A0A0A1USP2_9HYPO|nr:hypothetical protein X797_007928 [Metarhizium robertsii]